jgi:nitrogen fixation NifU-like protein
MSLDQLYQQIILDHAKVRHGSGLAGIAAPAGASTGQSHPVSYHI